MSLSKLTNIHHAAYRCRDAEQTRWFYEEVLGLRYRAALTFEEVSGTDIQREYMHLFFEMEDGSMVAFFDEPYTVKPDQFEQKDSFDVHVAFEIDNLEDLEVWKRKIKDARIKCAGPIDHGFVKSIYSTTRMATSAKSPAGRRIIPGSSTKKNPRRGRLRRSGQRKPASAKRSCSGQRPSTSGKSRNSITPDRMTADRRRREGRVSGAPFDMIALIGAGIALAGCSQPGNPSDSEMVSVDSDLSTSAEVNCPGYSPGTSRCFWGDLHVIPPIRSMHMGSGRCAHRRKPTGSQRGTP
jgi:catechol 2,3-dioxygenase-like lactoylglutathione lyase family enzyme